MVFRYCTTLAVILLTGCATAPETTPFEDYPPVAEAGQLADTVITVAAVSAGAATEANPILNGLNMTTGPGAAVLGALKLTLVWWSRTLPPDDCRGAYSGLSGLGWGATLANVVTLTVAPPVWATLTAGVAAGIGAGILTYDHVAEDACGREDMSVFE